MRRIKNKVVIGVLIVIIFVIYFFGLLDHIYELSYETSFDYPIAINIMPLAQAVIGKHKPRLDPINNYNHKFLTTNLSMCKYTEQDLVILVKSAMEHFDRRVAIRKTWGSETQHDNYRIKTVFFLGMKNYYSEILQEKIDQESKDHNDIVQSDFIDSYFNNTIKTMMAFRWAYEHCPLSKFYMFSDDDMFVSVRNAIKFTEDPGMYPRSNDRVEIGKTEAKNEIKRTTNNQQSYQSDGFRNIPYATNYSGIFQPFYRKMYPESIKPSIKKNLYAGFVFKSAPHRHLSSKWYVPLEEYPWDMWPPYVTAGAYILSQETMKLMYAGSLFVKHFRFDDIYLGIVAKKLGIKPFHCDYFYFYKKPFSTGSYKDLIASHGYHNPVELIKVWADQNMMSDRS